MNKLIESYLYNLSEISPGDVWSGIKINVGGTYQTYFNQCRSKKCKFWANTKCNMVCNLYASKQTLAFLNAKRAECKGNPKCIEDVDNWISKMQNKIKMLSTQVKTKM